jgi:hypothetical protein
MEKVWYETRRVINAYRMGTRFPVLEAVARALHKLSELRRDDVSWRDLWVS